MKPVRLGFHKGYRHIDGTPYIPKHDDRNGFEKSKSAENNVYENYAALIWGGETFYDSEIACYEACFRPHIKAQNDRNRKARHPERNLSLKQYYEKHPPEETLLYLGNKDNNVGAEVLERVFEDYRAWLQNECVNEDEGCGVKLLNRALHMDEATPHIQYRQIYYATDKDGNFEISQNKALAGLGFERPDITSKISRTNNAKVTFTAVCREKMIEIAKSHGVELITKPLPKEKSGQSLEVYKARAQMEEEFQEREKVLCAETESAKQAIQAERAELCAEKEKLAKHEQSIENAYNKLKKAIEKTKVEIKQNEEIISYQHEEIDNQKDYIAFKRAKADEKAEQEAEKAREEREELARKLREEQETNDEIIDMSMYYVEDEEEQETQNVQNAPETPETVPTPDNTPKARKPLKNDRRSSEAYAKLKKANSELITTEEAVALLLEL